MGWGLARLAGVRQAAQGVGQGWGKGATTITWGPHNVGCCITGTGKEGRLGLGAGRSWGRPHSNTQGGEEQQQEGKVVGTQATMGSLAQ